MSWFSNLLSRWFPRPAPLPPASGDIIGDLLAAHNTLRIRNRLPSLRLASELLRSAQGHADWMAQNRTLDHNEGLSDAGRRMRSAGYFWTACSENIAAGQNDVAAVMQSWQSSFGHMQDILGPYSEVGFGRSVGSDGIIYWCADFGTR